jgi:DDE family transposase
MAGSRPNGGWGDKVHLTESCDEDQPRLITHVETSLAGKGDVDVTPVIHQALQDKQLLPKEQLTDTNSAESKQFVASQLDYGIDLIAPTRVDNKWQGQAKQGFDASSFQLDWQTQKATCPTGHKSSSWTPALDRRDKEVIKIKFSTKDCQACSCRSQCTQTDRRTITVRKEDHHLALQKARARQHTPEFGKLSHKRAGIEATMSQGVRAFGMRRSRYEGLAKTHLQQVGIAAAINVVRIVAWLDGDEPAPTRLSAFQRLYHAA